VIRHQTIREKRHGAAVRRTAHQFDTVLIVLAIREYDLTTVSAFKDVMGVSGRNDSYSTRAQTVWPRPFTAIKRSRFVRFAFGGRQKRLFRSTDYVFRAR
jgi:hypothetical protein